MSLAIEVREHLVRPGTVTLWWLGQEGFLFKSPGGKIAAIDPYLTNSCKNAAAEIGLNSDRLFPPPILPSELDVDVMAFTHSHQDHCDPETILLFRATGRKAIYVAPGETAEKLTGLGISPEEILLVWPNKEHRFGDIRIKATFAIPYWSDDVTHVGYLISADGAPMVYVTGDTDYHEVLGYVAEFKPDIMITVINGAFRNLGPNEATKLTAKINPSVVIPCHYDMFPDNSLDPRLFRTCLIAAGMSEKYLQLQHGTPCTFPR